jgi:hypothetical protein
MLGKEKTYLDNKSTSLRVLYQKNCFIAEPFAKCLKRHFSAKHKFKKIILKKNLF